jgi:hypothetical protein
VILAISAAIGLLCAVVMATLIVTERFAALMVLVTAGYVLAFGVVIAVMAHVLLSGVLS